jgi:REP element-mobilizing transposase RayT
MPKNYEKYSMNSRWHWQKKGTAWKGMGIYHVTMVVPSREPLLGKLVIPDDDPEKAYVEHSDLGTRLIKMLLDNQNFYPEVRVLQFCIMPDHLHAILHVMRPMEKTFNTVVRSIWQGAKKIARSYFSSISPESHSGILARSYFSSISPESHSGIFTEHPFIRPMSRKGQLQTMIRYVQMNPQRLATKHLKPGFFYVQEHVEIAGREYCAVGNAKLLQAARLEPVHVRSMWVRDAEEHGYDEPLRNYKNGCVQAAREGAVMVSPFISEHERAVLEYLLQENRPIIYIADNGFGKYYKPSATLFDAVADGRMLILSPWPYDPKKKDVTRAECTAMNRMAEEICGM